LPQARVNGLGLVLNVLQRFLFLWKGRGADG
jgi:hypothetical protein